MSQPAQDPAIIDLDPGDARLSRAWAVLGELRPHLDDKGMDAVYAASHPLGYRITSRWVGGRCCAVAGWRIGVNMHLGRNLYVEDLVTSSTERSAGHGKALLDHLRQIAQTEGCAALHLDSGVQRHGAHRFYLREGLHISSHHFMQVLDPR